MTKFFTKQRTAEDIACGKCHKFYDNGTFVRIYRCDNDDKADPENIIGTKIAINTAMEVIHDEYLAGVMIAARRPPLTFMRPHLLFLESLLIIDLPFSFWETDQAVWERFWAVNFEMVSLQEIVGPHEN